MNKEKEDMNRSLKFQLLFFGPVISDFHHISVTFLYFFIVCLVRLFWTLHFIKKLSKSLPNKTMKD